MTGRPVRVLLVEHDPAARLLWENFFAARREFSLCGWARDGWSGLEAAAGEDPDAVLMDLVLPGMDGLEFLRTLKRREGRPAVVVASRISGSQVIQRALSLGADYYFVKPVRLQAVAELLQALCGGSVEGYARQILLEMGGRGLGLEAACAAAAELAGDRTMLLKEAYAPFIRRAHTSYGCVEKNIRELTGKLQAGATPAYRLLMGGLPAARPSNGAFLQCLCRAALERQAAGAERPEILRQRYFP